MIGRSRRHADKRNSPRLSERFPVTVLEAQVSAEGGAKSTGQKSYWANAVASKASGTNISKGGLAFEAKKPYRVGTVLAFEVVLPEPGDDFLPLIRRFVERRVKDFRALCQVIWVGVVSTGHYRMGVRFIDTNELRSSALDQLVTEYRWQQRFMSSVEEGTNRLISGDNDCDDLGF